MQISYDMPVYRPPSEGENLIIQATLGCSFNQCSFCSMYKQKDYAERQINDIIEDVRRAAAYDNTIRRVFLADGDALALPTQMLLTILAELHHAFPNLTRVSCYATPSNVLHKSVSELSELKNAKLSLIYLGIESGANEILKKVTKGASHHSIGEALHKAHDQGLKVSGTVILGLGGTRLWQQHIDGTVELLNNAPITYLSTLQLVLHESARLEFLTKFKTPFDPQDDLAILQEQKRLITNLNPPQSVIFRSNHASNAFALAGNLPQDKEKLLHQLQLAIDGLVPIRPHFMRSL